LPLLHEDTGTDSGAFEERTEPVSFANDNDGMNAARAVNTPGSAGSYNKVPSDPHEQRTEYLKVDLRVFERAQLQTPKDRSVCVLRTYEL
jgi:hypothetical protein